MSRRHITFDCEGETLVGTLDEAAGNTGLLIVSGGNEIRCGAFGGQVQLAARIAEAGYPVFRFDRRGVGDSSGENLGYRESLPDILAALAAFCAACPQVQRVVAFGNCDAASALMLASGAGCQALVLSNPWTFEDEATDAIPPAAIRARYAAKLRNPRELLRLLTGKVSLRKLLGGLRQATSAPAPASPLVDAMQQGMASSPLAARYLLAANDRTAQAFMAQWDRNRADFRICEGASHAYVEPHARAWLEAQVLSALEEQARQLDVG